VPSTFVRPQADSPPLHQHASAAIVPPGPPVPRLTRSIRDLLAGALCRFDDPSERFPPTRLLSPEDACRHLKEGGCAVQGETFAPRTRRVPEVFFNEGGRRCTSPIFGHRTHPGPACQVSEKWCHVSNRVAERDRVEIDEEHLLAGHKEMVRLEIPVNRRR